MDEILPQFDHEDLQRSISDEARLAIADLILAWASLDTMMSYWLLTAFELPMDTGSILIGNMSLETKIKRLEQAFDHSCNAKSTASLKRLMTEHDRYVATRNTIAHRSFVGTLKSDPSRLVFSSVKRIHRKAGQFELLAIGLDQIRAATAFAVHAKDGIFAVTEAVS